MHSLLGPLPLSPYQEGKYFTDFKKYVSRNSLVHGTHAQLIISFNVSQFLFFILCLIGHCEKVVNVMKKLKSTDFIFADFVTKLLAFDPCKCTSFIAERIEQSYCFHDDRATPVFLFRLSIPFNAKNPKLYAL